MSRQRTHLSLEAMTIGYLRYLVEHGETDNLYSIVDTLVEAYVENYAEETGKSLEEINGDALELFNKSRRPQSNKSKAEQMTSAKKSLQKVRVKGQKKPNDYLSNIGESLAGNFSNE